MMLTDAAIDSLRPKRWEEKTVEIPVKHDPLNKKGKIEWTVKPTIEDKAIRVQDLMLMETLKSNDWNRPVYFSTTVYSANKIGLDKYLSLEGLVFKLNSHEGKSSIEKLNSNLTKVYTYDGVNDEHIGNVDEIANLYQNYRDAFITLASLYDEAGQKEKVKEVLDFMDEKLPEAQLSYSSEELLNKSDSLYDKNL
jgi:hypothetical protein